MQKFTEKTVVTCYIIIDVYYLADLKLPSRSRGYKLLLVLLADNLYQMLLNPILISLLLDDEGYVILLD